MQKKLLPILILLSTSALAQPTITSSNNPVNGDAFTYYMCDSVGPGSAGANVTWNFANLTTTSNYTGTFQNCPGAPSCNVYPGSTIGMEQGTAAAGYYVADANRFAWNGERVNTTMIFTYSNPKDVRRYPFTMGDSFTDDHKCAFTSGTDFTRTGVVDVEVDGYGTLILPTGTFTDCLRLHIVDSTHDSSHVMPMLDQNYIRETYQWYKQGYHEFIFHVEILTTLPGSFVLDTMQFTSVAYTSGTVSVGDISKENTVNIYPVPAHDNINIELSVDVNSIEMTDIVGRSIMTVHYIKGQSKYTLNTSNVPTGVYFIRIKTAEGMITRKIEIQ